MSCRGRLVGASLVALGVLSACKPQAAVEAGPTVSVASALARGDAAGSAPVPDGPVAHRVAISGMKFVPARLQVKVGERIRWTNEDLVPHTVTASDRHFDSSILAPNASWDWTPTTAGDLPYACLLHPTMAGLVSVR